jgi:hypothetical protein
MMKYNKILIHACLVVFPFYTGIIQSVQAPKPTAPGQMGMPAGADVGDLNIEEFEQELTSQINAFVSTLPEDEQKMFHELVEEETRKMEAMSEDQLNEYIQQVLDEIEQAQKEIETEQPIVPTPEVKPTPVTVVEAPIDDTEKAMKVINNVITRTERFLRQTLIIPELPGKIDQWVSKDKVKEWQVDLTWETLKGKIEMLDQIVTQLKERDPNNKKYRYIPALLKKEEVYAELVKLSEKLTESEPLVEGPEFGLGKVSKESRDAIQKVLSAFAESIYTRELPDNLIKILGEFEPRAKEIRDEDEKARTKALEDSKKGVKEGARKEIGGKGGKDAGFGAGQDFYDEGGGYPGGYQGGSYGDYPDYQDYGRDFDQTERKESGDKGGTASKPATPAKDDKAADKDKARSKDYGKVIESIESAASNIEEVIVMSKADNVKQYIDGVVKGTPNKKAAFKSSESELDNAATSLRKARRKMKGLVAAEQVAVRDRVKKESLFTEVVSAMSSMATTEDSPAELVALDGIATAVKQFYN